MRREFTEPEMEVIRFGTEDILTASGFGDNDAENPWGDGDLG